MSVPPKISSQTRQSLLAFKTQPHRGFRNTYLSKAKCDDTGEQKVQWKQKRKVIQASASVFQYAAGGVLSVQGEEKESLGKRTRWTYSENEGVLFSLECQVHVDFGQDVEDLKLHTESLDSMQQGAIEVRWKSQIL